MASDLEILRSSAKRPSEVRERCEQLESELHRLRERIDWPECRPAALIVWRKLLKEYALLELMEARAIVRTRPPPPGRLLKWAAVCGLQGAAVLAGIAVDSPAPAVREEALRSIEIVLAREFQEIIVQACLHRIWSDELGAVGFQHESLGWMELDIPLRALPKDVQLGDCFPMTLFCDAGGRIRNWEVDPVMLSDSCSRAAPHPLHPREPADWGDPVQVARYRKELDRLFGTQDA